jgi:hypothetical protein
MQIDCLKDGYNIVVTVEPFLEQGKPYIDFCEGFNLNAVRVATPPETIIFNLLQNVYHKKRYDVIILKINI